MFRRDWADAPDPPVRQSRALVPGSKDTQPGALYPGNNAFLYSYGGFKTADQRLYQDMSVGLADMQGNATVMGYSDWGATFNWSDSAGKPKLQTTLGEGLPYAYFNASFVDAANGTPMQIVMGNPAWLNFTVTATPYDPATGQLSATAEKKGALMLSISYDVVNSRRWNTTLIPST